jgi:hypothetical protein
MEGKSRIHPRIFNHLSGEIYNSVLRFCRHGEKEKAEIDQIVGMIPDDNGIFNQQRPFLAT